MRRERKQLTYTHSDKNSAGENHRPECPMQTNDRPVGVKSDVGCVVTVVCVGCVLCLQRCVNFAFEGAKRHLHIGGTVAVHGGVNGIGARCNWNRVGACKNNIVLLCLRTSFNLHID